MDDREVRLEALRINFYQVAEAKQRRGDKSPITITEIEGDDAFNEWVEAGMPNDFEDVTVGPVTGNG